MSDTGPLPQPAEPTLDLIEPEVRAPSWRVPGLIARLRRGPAPEENLDSDDARTIGLVGIDRHRRPR